jgi:hypothetical protein
MDDPQIWTLIGVFAAVMLGGMTLMTTLLTRTIRAETGRLDARFDAVDAKFDARFLAVDSRFEAMDAKFTSLRAEMNARFDATDVKLGHLDRDVAHLMNRAWGAPSSD